MANENQNNNGLPPPLKKAPPPVLVNGVPISHRVDNSDSDAIRNIIENNTNVQAPSTPEPDQPPSPPPKQRPPRQPRQAPKMYVETPKAMPPEVEDEPQADPVEEPPRKKMSPKNAINAFKSAIASSLFPVRMYSANKEVNFRELTVTDQKSISKIALENNSRRDIIYNAQCAMINKCADETGFSIYDYTEFDRIVVLLRLYEANYFKNEIKYTCPVCHRENVYKLDFGKILGKLQNAWVPRKEYVVQHQNKTFRLTASWPKVAAVSEFYNQYYRPYNNSNENVKNTIDQLSNVEYLVMFIDGIDLIVGDSEPISLDLNEYNYADRTDVIDSLPQGVIFDDDDGVISKIVSDFTDPLNKVFQYEKCMYCGAESDEGIGSLADFT